jgi:CubicO group peptidase (beta-lactamase class C family)
MPPITRRTFIGSAAALAASPAFTQKNDWPVVAMEARALDQCRAIIIYREGTQVLAERFRGPPLDRVAPVKSVSKTLVAALAGTAIDRGEIPSVSATLGELAPELIPGNADAKVADITIENLLTMQAGLQRTSGPNYGRWIGSSNWIANALSLPMVAEPGTRMQYSTGSYHILGAVLSAVSGQSLLSLARNRLGRPLKIEIPAWTRDPQGRYLGGNEMALTLTAMIRFGELYRNEGRVGNQQVLSKHWATQSLVPVTRSMFSGLAYGYGWFLGEHDGISYALARGYGGQIICIIPALAVTVAITSDPNRPARSAGYFGDLLRLIESAIIPAAQSENV